MVIIVYILRDTRHRQLGFKYTIVQGEVGTPNKNSGWNPHMYVTKEPIKHFRTRVRLINGQTDLTDTDTDNWSERSACAALGMQAETQVATIKGVISLSLFFFNIKNLDPLQMNFGHTFRHQMGPKTIGIKPLIHLAHLKKKYW